MARKGPEEVTLSSAERELVEKVAQRKGMSVEDAASVLVSSAIARRIRRKTGKAPAKIFRFPGR